MNKVTLSGYLANTPELRLIDKDNKSIYLANFLLKVRKYIKNKSNLQKSAEELVALANERGGGDNITIVALEREKCDNEQW